MAIPKARERAIFFVGILARNRAGLALAGEVLAERYGMPERGSTVWKFENTGYYRDELGDNPLRAFLAWGGEFATEELADRKLATNGLEVELAALAGGASARPVNLDPGYLTPAKLVLASAKNYSHRVHLGNGIYGEVTMQYRGGQGGRFISYPWTFPDYGSGRYDDFFLDLRRRLF